VHHQREARQFLLNPRQDVKMQRLRSAEFERPMAGANRDGERIATGALHKIARLLRVGQFGIRLIHLDMLFHAAQLPQFRFHHNAFGMRRVHHALGDGNVFLVGFAAGVNHDRAVETRRDAVVTGLFIAVVQMNREDGFRIDFVSSADQTLKEGFIGVAAGTFADLDDEWRLRVDVAAEQADNLLKVVYVISTDSILAIGMLK